jgi:glutamate synthase (NADPH/NADH) small chain
MTFRVSSAHEEGGERIYSVSTQEFRGDAGGRVRSLRLADIEMRDGRPQPVEGSEREIPCDLALLAMGFTGAEPGPLLSGLGVELTERGNVARDAAYATSVPGVFAAGDMGRGQSLIVWAIAEGRSAAAAVDRYLNAGRETAGSGADGGTAGGDAAGAPAAGRVPADGFDGGTVLPTAIPATARPIS